MKEKTTFKISIKNYILFFILILAVNVHSQNTYTYDNLNRLKTATLSNGTQIQYIYDELGNRTVKGVTGGGYNISGQVVYARPAGAVAMNNMQIQLRNSSDAVVQTVTTNSSGNYQFTNISNGAYTITLGSSPPWSLTAVTSFDLYLFQRDIVGVTPLGTFYKQAGDVDKNATTNSYDLYLIQRRIVGLSSSFASGDWLFENAAVTVSGSNVNKTLNLLMYGDANGSYNP